MYLEAIPMMLGDGRVKLRAANAQALLMSLSVLGTVSTEIGELTHARSVLEETVSLGRAVGDGNVLRVGKWLFGEDAAHLATQRFG